MSSLTANRWGAWRRCARILPAMTVSCMLSGYPLIGRAQTYTCRAESPVKLIVLGVAQDAGYPQAGTKSSPAFGDYSQRRFAASIAVVVAEDSSRWLFDATPDFRDQLHFLDTRFPVPGRPGLDGIFLTHAHIGHYLGLAQLGHEVMGAANVPVYVMPRMKQFLSSNGPWDQLVRFNNIDLRSLNDESVVQPTNALSVTPFRVPHRDEYSETVGFTISSVRRTVVYIPDINKWEAWDAWGFHLEDVVRDADIVLVDGTFYADGELPGRDMSAILHPFISETMSRLDHLPDDLRSRVFFTHMNHTNPALDPESFASAAVAERGYHVASEGDCFAL